MTTVIETDRHASGIGASPLPTFMYGLVGFVLSVVLAWLVVVASFALVYLPSMPRAGRVVAITIGLCIGLTQVVYLVPIHVLARRRWPSAFCTGIRTGGIAILLANIAMFILTSIWPSFND